MFVQTVISTRAQFDEAMELLDMADDPPGSLVAAVAFSSGEDEVTLVNVWESPGAMSDFFVERIHPRAGDQGMQGRGESAPRGEPLFFWAR